VWPRLPLQIPCGLPEFSALPEVPALHAPPLQRVTEAIPDGMVVDFITGSLVRDTPEEYVRQNVERDLIQRFNYRLADCAPEKRIRVGSSNKRVDVAVFTEGAEHTQEHIYIVIECKKPGTHPQNRRDGIEQCKSYMAACVNAKYGMWTNGDDRYLFVKRPQAGSYVFEEILELPSRGQSEEEAQRPRRKDLKPATADNLMFAFRRCHNYIAGTEGMHKTEAFWELLKLVFCKVEDERSRTLDFYVVPAELSSGTSGQGAKARLEALFANKVVRKYPTIFSTAEARDIQLKPNTIAFVVSQLQSYSLLRSPIDVKGKAYEEIVGANLRGDRGEFFTPRNACQMAVQMLNPEPGLKLLDPACGTGGFLITAMNHALEIIEREEQATWDDQRRPTEFEVRERDTRRQEYLSEFVHGLDLNPNLVRAAKMNMVMNNDGSGGLWQANSLENPHSWKPDARSRLQLGTIDIVITNPPFGANILIDDEDVLRQYDLAAVWDRGETEWEMRVGSDGVPVLQSSQPPEILFIERCVQFLKPGSGRMALVLPNGILNNPALGYVRQWLLKNTQVLAVVDMARELFQPRNDTQTSMLLCRRFSAEERAEAAEGEVDYPIFMAVAEKIGHDKRGNSLFRRDEHGDDVVQVSVETVVDPALDDDDPDYFREVEVRERKIDDELPEVAEAYRQWLGQYR
jgi:type I restriction enzyme M protein